MTEKKSIENMSFEEAMSELELIVKQVDSGKDSLEESIAAYERGAKLRSHCEKKLKEAKLKIEKITQDANNKLETEEIDL